MRSQVYRGVLAEVAASTAAVRATRGRVVTVGGEVAQTFFFSTSGGRTAANEEGFGGSPISYLRSVEDPHDDLSPVHTWTARFTRARGAAQARLARDRPAAGARGRDAVAVGARRDGAGARERGRSDGVGRVGADRAGAAQHVDREDHRAVGTAAG